LYLATFYDKDMTYEEAHNIVRARMWDKGHSFDEIDKMSLEDIGIVLGYWTELNRIEAKRARMRANKGKH